MVMQKVRCWFAVLGCAVAVTGCASGATGPGELVFFPPPPDTARIQFLTSFTYASDLEAGGGSFWDAVVGRRETGELYIEKPYGVGVGPGRVCVCDTRQDLVVVLDLVERKFEYFDPGEGSILRKPINCSIDAATDRLYVADTGHEAVLIFEPDGTLADSLKAPEGSRYLEVFIEPTELWVADSRGSRIRVFDKASLEEKRSLPAYAPGEEGFLGLSTNMWLTEERLYVTDFGRSRVQVYTRDGEYIRTIGRRGDAVGQFVRPKGLAVDREERLYVVDAAFENVQVFDADGRLLMFFGGDYGGPGAMALPAQIVIDYDNVSYFGDYVAPGYGLEYLIFLTNQYGPARLNVYGFLRPGETDAAVSQ